MYEMSQKYWNIHKLEIFEVKITCSNIFFCKNFRYNFINKLPHIANATITELLDALMLYDWLLFFC